MHQPPWSSWVRFPNERNQGKQTHPVLKYRVPHGSQDQIVPLWRGADGGGVLAGTRRPLAAGDGVPPSLHTASHTHIARSLAWLYSPFRRRAHSPTAFSGLMARPPPSPPRPPVLVLVLHFCAVTVSSTGPRKLFKEMTTATSGVLARFPWLLPIRNSLRVTGPLQSLVLRAEDMWRKRKPMSSK